MHFLTGALTCHVLHTKSCIACHSSQYSLVLNANVKYVGSWKINSFYTAKFNQISWGFFWQFLQNLSSERCINWNVVPHYRHPLRVGVHRWSGGRMTLFWLCSIVASQFSLFLLITSRLLFLLSILKLIVLLQKHLPLSVLWSFLFAFKFTIDHCVALEKIMYAC